LWSKIILHQSYIDPTLILQQFYINLVKAARLEPEAFDGCNGSGGKAAKCLHYGNALATDGHDLAFGHWTWLFL
jgi:hypothetical protein